MQKSKLESNYSALSRIVTDIGCFLRKTPPYLRCTPKADIERNRHSSQENSLALLFHLVYRTKKASDKQLLTIVAVRVTGVTRRIKKVRPKIQARENNIPQETKIEITIAPSLLDHFTENLSRQHPSMPSEEAITRLVTTILDSSAFPIEARQTGGTEIRIAYHLRSFSQPIFWT